jgi:hypothetical protein
MSLDLALIGLRSLKVIEGDTGVDIEINVINRFSESEFEIPLKLLTRNDQAHNWEVKTMGWLPNPLAKVDPSLIKPGPCPQ